MIELTNAIVLNKTAPKEEISFSFDAGELVSIPYEERYKFEFLSLRNQSLDKGVFKIDETTIFPDEDNEKTIFFLAINSLIKVGLCFLVQKTEKKKIVTSIQEELIKFRDYPTETEEQKNTKIAGIFFKIAELSPSYVLINFNEEVNKNNAELRRQIDAYKTSLLIIGLEVKPQIISEVSNQNEQEDDHLIMTSLNIGEGSVEMITENNYKDNDFLVFANTKKGLFKDIIFTFKENLMVFFSFLIPTIGVIAFLLLAPLYGKPESTNKALIIPFIITIVICFALYMLMTYKCTAFLQSKNKKEKYRKLIMFLILNFVVTLLGAGLGVVIYVLFKNFDTELKSIGNNSLGIILSIIFGLILITACLYLRYIIDKIISLFKKKKWP